MTLLLVPLTFVLLFFALHGSSRSALAELGDWRCHFLEASLWLGSFAVLASETLGLFHALNTIPLTIAWSLALVTALFLGLRGGAIRMGYLGLRKAVKSLGRFDGVVLALVSIFVATLFVIAWLSPPNTMDSLQYHMARVVHWAQNRSLQHYATQFLPQLVNPIGGELAILNLRLLYGTDQPAGLVQWGAFVGSLVAASLLASRLGAGRKGQWAAVGFVASLPMGIMQATSTQNDYVVAFWMMCLACAVVEAYARDLTAREWVGLGMALGLGLLTKGTFYPFALPWIVLVGARMLLRRAPLAWARAAGLVVVPVLVLNMGFWTRNWLTFGSPLGPRTWTTSMANSELDLRRTATTLVLNTMLNFSTPLQEINTRLETWATDHLPVGTEIVGGFDLYWGWNHEDLAGNPIHLLLVPGAALGLLVADRRPRSGILPLYILCSLGMFVALALVIPYSTYGIRYQLPFLVSWGPVFGVSASRVGERRLAAVLSILMLAMALPWLLFNRSRPLIGMKHEPEPLAIPCLRGLGCDFGSLLLEPPSRILFSNLTHLRAPYEDIARRIQATDCRSVGLALDSHDPEYAFWWLLEAPQSGFRLEAIRSLPELERYIRADFEPCAIICTTCGERTSLHGLRLAINAGGASLFLGGEYQPSEGT
jgi:hypothetical protein